MKRLGLMLCAFGFPLLLRAEVPILAFVVCGEGGSPMSASHDDVTNYVGKLNFVFSQVGIDFQLAHYSVITNDAWLSIVGSNESQYEALCATTNSTGGIEMYFVQEIDDCTAFKTPSGIVISQSANWRSVAHEVGHLCGLKDIYDDHTGTSLRVTGRSSETRMPSDYGRPNFTTPHVDRIRRLLMYGYSSNSKLAISGGDIYGLERKRKRNEATGSLEDVWDLFNVEVGFWVHGTRTPRCE